MCIRDSFSGGPGARSPPGRPWYMSATPMRFGTSQIASGVRNLKCVGPGTASNSAPEGLVRG
eukprot:3314201-Alexandrium_andersonii.AAC.1